jgi:hypothetical protein
VALCQSLQIITTIYGIVVCIVDIHESWAHEYGQYIVQVLQASLQAPAGDGHAMDISGLSRLDTLHS